nr:unnamed protein product [Callosobruchus chinensis]
MTMVPILGLLRLKWVHHKVPYWVL